MSVNRTSAKRYLLRGAGNVIAAASVLVLPALGRGTASAAPFSPEILACRAAIGKNAVKLTKTELKAVTACHKARARDASMSGVNCNDIDTADSTHMVPPAEQKFVNALTSSMSRCAGITPSDALYLACPPPCDSAVPNISTFADVADCLLCLTRSRIEAFSDAIHGTPASPLSSEEARCDGTIGSGGARLFSLVTRDVTRCQVTEEAAGSTSVDYCTNSAFPSQPVDDGTFETENAIVSACDLPSFSDLDSCADSQFGVAECVGQDTLDAAQVLVTEVLSLPVFTTTTTTTTLPPDPQCPDLGKLVLFSRDTNIPCSSNGDCAPPRSCNTLAGICESLSDLDSGWTGLAHNSDLDEGVTTLSRLVCPGPAPTCGECSIAGVDPSTSNCRCSNNTRTICDETFHAGSTQCPACVGGRGKNGLSCTTNAECLETSTCTKIAKVCSNNNGQICSTNGDCNSPGTCTGSHATCSATPNTALCTNNNDCVFQGTCSGTADCECYFGVPIPLSSAGTPACIVNRYAEDISGTVNVDDGSSNITANLRTKVYLGVTTDVPCPFCGGNCSNSPTTHCVFDNDCGAGNTCVQDIPNDGIRGGTCFRGANDGQPCDVGGVNPSFPAQSGALVGGGGYSLDCFPSAGVNISGAGLELNVTQTTGTQSLDFNLPCTGGNCPCKTCSATPSQACHQDSDCSGGSCAISASFACTSNADCSNLNLGTCSTNIHRCSLATDVSCSTNTDCQNYTAGGPCQPSTCSSIGGSSGAAPAPNGCSDLVCNPAAPGSQEGVCATGPDDRACDGLVRADGTGVLSCNSNSDCSANNPLNGNCTLVRRRACFLDPIVAQGIPDTQFPVGAAAFCVPPTSNGSINQVAGLPGPTRVINQGSSTALCAGDHNVEYQPGVGGCP